MSASTLRLTRSTDIAAMPCATTNEGISSGEVAYTRNIGVLATAPHNANTGSIVVRRPVKFVYWPALAYPGVKSEVPWFEVSEEQAGAPGATVVSLGDWPSLWQHPERANTLRTIARLVSHVDELEHQDWSSVLEAIELALHLHPSPQQKFDLLAKKWLSETSLCSDSTQMSIHPAYQQIIGMGTLALPFIFRELEQRPNHWFWALQAITGENPVGDEQRGDIVLMSAAWLTWARDRRRRLTLSWLHAYAASETC